MKNIFVINSIKTRLKFWFFGVSILPLLIASIVIYQQRVDSIKQEAFIKLTAIRDLKVRQINDWISERIGDINVIGEEFQIFALSDEPEKKGNSELHINQIRNYLSEHVKNYVAWNEISFIDSETGIVKFSSNKLSEGLDQSSAIFYEPTIRKKGVYVSDIYLSKSLSRPVMVFSKIIYGTKEKKSPVGMIVARVDLNNSLYNMLLDRSGMGSTGETLIVNKDSIALNELRWYKGAPLNLLIKAKPAVLASQGNIGITETSDYREEPILAAYGFILKTHWGFVAKQDQSEIYSPIDGLINNLLLIIAISLVAVYLISSFVANTIARPVLEMTEVSKKIQDGDLLVRNNIFTGDELGFLSNSFNQMADSVMSQVFVQKSVAELTETLVNSKNINDFSEMLLIKLMDISEATFGAFFLRNESKKQFDHLKSIGATSESLSSFDSTTLEGEFGKVLSTKKISYLYDIPDDTVFKLKLSIGIAIPKTIITIPIICFGNVAAIISIASIKSVTPDRFQVIKLIQTSLNTIFTNIQSNEATKTLASELEHKNTELRGQADEMKRQSEELSQQNQELDMQRNQVEEANRLKSEFLSNMSHELRTPLNSIMALSRILIRRAKNSLSEEESGFLEIISRNGKNLLSLINDILDLSKIEAGKVDVDAKQFFIPHTLQTILDSVRHIADEKNILIDSRIDEDIPEIISDETRVHQILQNIIGNAIKFTVKGSVNISVTSDPRNIIIKVRDTGIGISEKALPSIFTEFRQADGSSSRQFEGTGLGLAIAYKATKLLGGSITVESKLGQGSQFTVRLPIQKVIGDVEIIEPTPNIEKTPTPPELSSDKKTILIVDDDPGAVKIISGFLQAEGYNTITTDRGKKALVLAEEYQPFAITLDTIMPEMDGWEVLQKLKDNQKTSDIPVIIISIADDKKTGYALGATGYITKPISKQALVTEIKKVDCPNPHSILLVDDDEIELMEMKRIIELDKSMVAIPVNNGQKCLDFVKRTTPDVIILDLNMPEMNGFEVLNQLRKSSHSKHIPVIISTAKDLSTKEQKILQKQAETVLTKNGTPEPLFEELRRFLQKLEKKTKVSQIIPKGRKARILLVEDNESAIIQVTNILQEEGYQVDVARGGIEAVQFVQKTIPDGIILDLMMPEMNGFQVLETIRGTNATAMIPVLILTAKDLTKDDLKQLSANNVQQLVQKGDVDPENLIFKIELMLGTIPQKRIDKKIQPKALKQKKVAVNQSKKTDKPTVLIIEDNQDNMITIKAMLEDSCHILEAQDGELGLEMVFKNSPDLVLLDMSLPKMDGKQVVKNIKMNTDFQDIPVIAITALAMKGESEKILDAGCDDYISKPIDIDVFIEKTKYWLAHKGSDNG